MKTFTLRVDSIRVMNIPGWENLLVQCKNYKGQIFENFGQLNMFLFSDMLL